MATTTAPQFAFLTWDAALGRRMCPLATFGSRAPASFTSRLVCVDPPRADCDELVNAADVRGAVALVVRGGCSFAQKARRIQAAGALAMILANNTREEPFAAFTMGESADDLACAERAPITIPCVMMSLFDVRELFRQFPPSVQTGTMHVEVLDMATDGAQSALSECSRLRQLAIQQSDASSSSSSYDARDRSGGWGSIKRWKPSSLMKLLEPHAATPSHVETSVKSVDTAMDCSDDGAGASPPASTREQDAKVAVSVAVAPDTECLPGAPLPAPETLRERLSSDTLLERTAPLFAFVLWAATAATYEFCYAPLADFGRVGNNAIYDGPLVVCDPIRADAATLQNASALSNAIALVQRGACTFPAKLERIQRCGAVAAIVGNDDETSPDAAFVMTVDQIKVDHVTMPSVMVSRRVFERLVAEKIAFVRIVCLAGDAAAAFMAQAGRPVSLFEAPQPTSSGGEALQLLHAACRDGDHGACQRVLDEHCSGDSARAALVRAYDANRLTALHHACMGGNEHVVELLLRLGAAVDAADIAMQTPLHFACLERHVSCARALVKAGAAAHAHRKSLTTKRNIGGSTPLHYAARAGSTDCLEVLLTANAHVDSDGTFCFDGVSLADNDGATPLHIACQRADVDCAMYLLAANADVNVVDRSGRTALQICCEAVNDATLEAPALHLVEKLVAAGASMRDTSASTGSLLLDYVESPALKRELEVMYLRSEARQSEQRASDLASANTRLATRLEVVETELQHVVEQNLAMRATEDAHAQAIAAQQSQIEQLHVQMKTIIQLLQSQSEGSPLPGAPAASLFVKHSSAASTRRGADAKDTSQAPADLNDGESDDETLAQEAALARDLGKKFAREQKFAIAEMYFDKSLELFPLPGVHRLLEQVRTLRREAEERKALEASHRQATRRVHAVSKAKLLQQLHATLAEARAPERAAQSIAREISKLAALEEHTPAFDTARKWVEWLVALPWGDPSSGLQNADFYVANADIFEQISALEHEERTRQRDRAACTIQRAFRERFAVSMLRRSIASVRIQAVARGYIARQQFDKMRELAAPLAYDGDRERHVPSAEVRNEHQSSDECALPLDYARTLDPLAHSKLRCARNAMVLAGVHLVRALQEQSTRQVLGSSAFHVLQLVQTASASKTDAFVPTHATASDVPVYYVWSRWGDDAKRASAQWTLSGPYDALDTAQQRYGRVLREQLQKKFAVSPPASVLASASTEPSRSKSTTWQQHKHGQMQRRACSSPSQQHWSTTRDASAPSRLQISTFSA